VDLEIAIRGGIAIRLEGGEHTIPGLLGERPLLFRSVSTIAINAILLQA
jgi:hypothetical protein